MGNDKLNEVLKEHKLWLETEGKEGQRADLSGANLEDADLRKADLRGACLEYADLGDAYLYGAKF